MALILQDKVTNKFMQHNWDSGGGLKFTYEGTTVKTIATPAITLGTSWTVTARIYYYQTIPAAAPYYNIATLMKGDNGILSSLAFTQNFLVIGNGVYYLLASTKLNVGNIIFISYRYNGTAMIGNVDNLQGAPITMPNPFATTSVVRVIGTRGDSTHLLTQQVNDIKIFNSYLSDADITSLYNTKCQIVPSIAASSLVISYKLDDKSGATAKDNSGNGRNGTLANFISTSLGASNAWVDKYGNPITQY